MSFLDIREVSKLYGETAAVRPTTLSLEKGEIFALLGPSGCGKSTLLSVIAGLVDAGNGSISLDGRLLDGIPAERRGIPMVFQDHLLFPGMTVAENVAFGLRAHKVPKAERARRIVEVLEAVQLGALDRRYPAELSGGQKQRVALARAMVLRPKILLMDEPFSSLDVALRVEMRDLVLQARATFGFAVMIVTHDPSEAMAMADRLAVMRDGAFVQVGTPKEVFDHPKTSFVAAFLGPANIIASDAGLVCVRPEALEICRSDEGLSGIVTRRYFTGSMIEMHIDTNRGNLRWIGAARAASACAVGSHIGVRWQPETATPVAAG